MGVIKMSNPIMNKGALACTIGLFIIAMSLGLALIVFFKCFGLAYQHDYNLGEYISAIFTRDAMKIYFVAGLIFFCGLYLTVNGFIRIVKDFFEV